MPYSKLHAAARNYAEAGWSVFPCRINGKEPACPNGYLDATTDLDKIDEWWNNGDWNIGFCPENAGLCVVDEDTDKGGKYEVSEPETVRSPHGRHFYYSGSLQPSASKISPNVDTRGRGSYVLLPPSIVDGLSYTARDNGNFPFQDYECSEIPAWVVERCNTVARPRDRAQSIKNDGVDRPRAIASFKRYLDRNPIPPEGQGSDDAVFRAIAKARDLGLSDEMIFRSISDMTEFEEWWILEKIENVETYAQNEAGCDIPLTSSEANRDLITRFASKSKDSRSVPRSGTEEGTMGAEGQAGTQISELQGRPPRDPATIPELGYHDNDKLIPKSPDGTIGILYGKRGDHKTNTLLSMLCNSGAKRILYACGEGFTGVERDRIPAHPGLKDRIYLVPRVPQLSLPDQIDLFVELNEDFNPDIVVIDTLATALAGENENDAMTAGYLTDNGTAATIKRAWNCTVIFVAHSGKDSARGVRGTSAFEANTDFLIKTTADKKHGAIETYCERQRNGSDGFSVFWKYDTDPTKVPVPERITEAEYNRLVADAPKDETLPVGMAVMSFLRLNGFHTWNSGIETAALAVDLCKQEKGGSRPDDVDEAQSWDNCRVKWKKSLDNIKSKSTNTWAKKCIDSQVPRGAPAGSEPILRWFCPPEDQSNPDL